MKSQIINKNLEATLTLIGDLIYTESFTADGGADFLSGKNISLKKGQKQFEISFILESEERHYFNTALETKLLEYKLTAESGNTYFAPEKSTLLTNIKDINIDLPEFEVSGSVSKLSTSPISDFEDKYHRVLIPISDSQFRFNHIARYRFDSDASFKNKELVKVQIEEHKFHLFTFKKDDKVYWAIDSLQKLTFRDFQELAYSIFNSYGFVTGDLHLNEAYYICSNEAQFLAELELIYASLRDSLITGYGIYTTNPYSVYVPLFRSQQKEIDHDFVKIWTEKLGWFREDVFSNLATLLHKYDSISRAALIVLEANLQPLELKAASYCVAFEAICHTIKKEFGIKSPNVIDNDLWDTTIKKQFSDLIEKLRHDNTINEDQERILSNKLNNWNQPTNRDSLTAPFTKYSYNLSKDEYKCIDNRNRFLHGSLPVNERDEDEAFRELYHISMTIHRLIYVLILKASEFNGFIINYPKLHQHITGRPIDEELFIEI
ncbi:MAG: hypothetical protein GX217_02550 [Clostridiaceae bacterium]|jgi:hypothetical protein|nr:hypothetical protein [Clostridiaceae bacterium]